jgi:hypothetical protein
MMLDTSQNAFWMDYKKTKWSNALFEHLKQLVVDWCRIETTIFPNHKDITTLRIGVREFKVHPINDLQAFEVDSFPYIYSHLSCFCCWAFNINVPS